MASVLVQFNAQPPAALFANAAGGAARLAILKNFYADLKARLRAKLAGRSVVVTDLDATGSVVLNGDQAVLDDLTRPGGDLEELDVTIAPNLTFVPLR